MENYMLYIFIQINKLAPYWSWLTAEFLELQVIEHMEEDQACLFGDVVLSYFCPKVLIVSTPNYEYNVILQKSSPPSQEEDPDEKTQSQSCKFRNHDHKFEWTREQFNHWATELAAKHNYSVEFSGVGGSADLEPGFASQIAVFRRICPPQGEDLFKNADTEHRYQVIWEWSSSTSSSWQLHLPYTVHLERVNRGFVFNFIRALGLLDWVTNF